MLEFQGVFCKGFLASEALPLTVHNSGLRATCEVLVGKILLVIVFTAPADVSTTEVLAVNPFRLGEPVHKDGLLGWPLMTVLDIGARVFMGVREGKEPPLALLVEVGTDALERLLPVRRLLLPVVLVSSNGFVLLRRTTRGGRSDGLDLMFKRPGRRTSSETIMITRKTGSGNPQGDFYLRDCFVCQVMSGDKNIAK